MGTKIFSAILCGIVSASLGANPPPPHDSPRHSELYMPSPIPIPPQKPESEIAKTLSLIIKEQQANEKFWSNQKQEVGFAEDYVRHLRDFSETNPYTILDKQTAAARKTFLQDPTKLSPEVMRQWVGWDSDLLKFSDYSEKTELTPEMTSILDGILSGTRDVSILAAFKENSANYSRLLLALQARAKSRLKSKIQELQTKDACFALDPNTFQKQVLAKSEEIQSKIQGDFEQLVALNAFGIHGILAPRPSDPATLAKIPENLKDRFKDKIARPLEAEVRSALTKSFHGLAGKCMIQVEPRVNLNENGTVIKAQDPIDELLASTKDRSKQAVLDFQPNQSMPAPSLSPLLQTHGAQNVNQLPGLGSSIHRRHPVTGNPLQGLDGGKRQELHEPRRLGHSHSPQ